MATISAKTGIRREVLLRLADARAEEFDILRAAGRYAAAVYLGGYVLELLLKCAACRSLNLEALPVELQTHDLEVLLLFSGFQTTLETVPEVHTSFRRIQSRWSQALRYADPVEISRRDCDDMAVRLFDPNHGVASWLRKKL
jgi:glutamate synthase domain-containing protein 2